jgi:hypothetical protein
MYQVDQHSFFQTAISTIDIDPQLWDKDQFINDVSSNYKVNPGRNCWNDNSDLHHYFNDWENLEYKKINFDNLIKVYQNAIDSFINSIPKNQTDMKWQWNIVNVTVYKNHQHMQIHDHFLGNTIFSAVHYVSVPQTHSKINFINPLLVSQYAHPLLENFTKFLDSKNISNSGFFSDWDFNVKEDTMIIFPSYLKHRVKSSPLESDSDELRIGVVINIDLG